MDDVQIGRVPQRRCDLLGGKTPIQIPMHQQKSIESTAPRATSGLGITRRLLGAIGVAAVVTGCFDTRPKYHRTDYKFSWQQEDTEAERRAGMIYTQPPKASYDVKD